jgi:hypothetical protein
VLGLHLGLSGWRRRRRDPGEVGMQHRALPEGLPWIADLFVSSSSRSWPMAAYPSSASRDFGAAPAREKRVTLVMKSSKGGSCG